MKKLFCYLFGHFPKKSPEGKEVNSHCSVCGKNFVYDHDLDHYFTEEEISPENNELTRGIYEEFG